MLRLMREAFEFMFTATDAVRITTSVPDGNEAALSWAAAAGFRDTFRREQCFPLMGEMVGQRFMAIDYEAWALGYRNAGEIGHGFHEALHALGLGDHAPDKSHDAMVGATLLCAQRNNLIKGVFHYNRYAAIAGYMAAEVISTNPPTVHTGDAIVTMEDGDAKILWAKVAEPRGDA
jgi:hypothetical protein